MEAEGVYDVILREFQEGRKVLFFIEMAEAYAYDGVRLLVPVLPVGDVVDVAFLSLPCALYCVFVDVDGLYRPVPSEKGSDAPESAAEFEYASVTAEVFFDNPGKLTVLVAPVGSSLVPHYLLFGPPHQRYSPKSSPKISPA